MANLNRFKSWLLAMFGLAIFIYAFVWEQARKPHFSHRVPTSVWRTYKINCCGSGACVKDNHHWGIQFEYKDSYTAHAPAKTSRDAKELADIYANDNHSFFNDKLPEATFSNKLVDPVNDMAETTYDNGIPNIAIGPMWKDANLTKYLLMFHEECHILADLQGDHMKHGKHWRACMLNLDAQGAFRDVLVYGSEDRDQ